MYLSPLEVLLKIVFFLFFFSSFEGRKDQNRAGDSPCKKIVSLVLEKNTHTHIQWIVVLGVCLARRTEFGRVGFSILLRAASMRHADFARVWTDNACDILVCARIRAVNTCQDTVTCLRNN